MSSDKTNFVGESPFNAAPHLPLFNDGSQEARVRRQYDALLDGATLGTDTNLVSAHRDVLEANLTNRFNHIKRQSITSEFEREVVRFSWIDRQDVTDRMATFALCEVMDSLELMSIVEAADKPGQVDGHIGDAAVAEFTDQYQATVHHHQYSLRPKVKRLIDIDEDKQAAVVTAKTGGRVIVPNDGEPFEVKTRHSGFVILDDTLDRQQLLAFKILGQMTWGNKITEPMVADFRETVARSISEEQLFYPTLCTLYLSKHISNVRSRD